MTITSARRRAIRPWRSTGFAVAVAGALVMAVWAAVAPEPAAAATLPAVAQSRSLAAVHLAEDLQQRTLVDCQFEPARPAASATRGFSERDRVAAFLAEEHRTPGSLARRADRLFQSGRDPAEQAALLIALADESSTAAVPALAAAVRCTDPGEQEHAESLPRLAFRLLAERARRDSGARQVLLGLGLDPSVDPALRVRAVAVCAAHGDLREVVALQSRLLALGDDVLTRAAADSLDGHPEVQERLRAALATGQ